MKPWIAAFLSSGGFWHELVARRKLMRLRALKPSNHELEN